MQGRRDEASLRIKEATVMALIECLGENETDRKERVKALSVGGWFSEAKLEVADNPLQMFLPQYRLIKLDDGRKVYSRVKKRYDRLMVITTLGFIAELSHFNIVKYTIDKIREGDLQKLYNELQRIKSIGPKIASFFLRDIVSLFELEGFLGLDDWTYTQPIDIWVKRVSHKIGIIESEDLKDEVIRKKIVKACNVLGLSPISYNQGAWYIGTHALDLLLEIL